MFLDGNYILKFNASTTIQNGAYVGVRARVYACVHLCICMVLEIEIDDMRTTQLNPRLGKQILQLYTSGLRIITV